MATPDKNLFGPVGQPADSPKRKIFLSGILVLFAAGIVFLGFLQLKSNLIGPLSVSSVQNSVSDDLGNNPLSEQKMLQDKDTDKDGLSDYDELNIYNTSPYLEDTDSDGYNDKQEIDNGHDPNCPAGQDCGAGPLIKPQEEGTEFLPPSVPDDLPGLESLSPDELRSLLKQELDNSDDTALMSMAQEFLAGAPDDLRNSLSPDEIRNLLKQNLDTLDDGTLMKMAREL